MDFNIRRWNFVIKNLHLHSMCGFFFIILLIKSMKCTLGKEFFKWIFFKTRNIGSIDLLTKGMSH